VLVGAHFFGALLRWFLVDKHTLEHPGNQAQVCEFHDDFLLDLQHKKMPPLRLNPDRFSFIMKVHLANYTPSYV
jgi:hypothetical protein